METSSSSQNSILTEVTTEKHSSSSPGPTVTETSSHGMSSSGLTTKTDNDRSTTVSATPSTLTNPMSTTASRSTVPPAPPLPDQGISLFPYGSEAGDSKLFLRTVDFNSPVFKIQIGFPLGSSLRDSFYFTDNGQIIFPESDYDVFSYPNPPQRSFTGMEHVAMMAPFWGDADFSSSRGAIFYQEYVTFYNEHHQLIREVETLISEDTSDWSFKAKWTLKVTWVNVPAYPAQGSSGTNTYQAILSTDGSRSYALFLYQSGGMRWDVTQGPYNRVLIGFSSGDGYFENSPLTFRPAMEKYRPDRFLNSRLGIRGLQVYRLHREVRPNYRLKCLWWLESQPQQPSWGWSQITCPCSWQQGQRDFRFRRMNTGWWDRQLCSFSSGRGGVCCSYGTRGEFREGWRMHSPWQFDEEQEAQNWCCRWNDKPSFCVRYRRRRPRISCGGYRPPRPAWTFGDPHITTLDNANYTFNGLGDFLLVQAQDRSSSFLLEGRTAQTGSASATNFIAFAAQYNTSSLKSPITVQWFLEPNNTIRVVCNNQTVAFNTSDAKDLPKFNTTGILLTQNGSQVSANFDGTVTISVIALSNILHASSSLSEEYRNHTEGLLGVWNDNPEDDFRMPNGSTIPSDSSEETLFHYGMTWQVNGTGLLGTRTDPLPTKFTPIFLSQLSNKSSSSEDLTSVCNGDKQCQFDILATGNRSIGQSTNSIFRTFQNLNDTLNQYPPFINCSSKIQAYKGRTVTTEITSDSKDVTFSLFNKCGGFELFVNGSLQWTPTSPEACTLEILATDVRTNLSSVLQPKTVACFCNKEDQCLYNETSKEGNSSLEVTSCKCDEDTFGRFCEHFKDPCIEPCFPNVDCIPGKGCQACPPYMTGDGRHCA
ncbi:mucin-4-like, partial [Grammomys surdaster]|uniref:mucin-4-like n=1 Tax=Grammomys surdaster TaxID=491861 RepID=UPI00109F5BD3